MVKIRKQTKQIDKKIKTYRYRGTQKNIKKAMAIPKGYSMNDGLKKV